MENSPLRSKLRRTNPLCTVIPVLMVLLIGSLIMVYANITVGAMLVVPCCLVILAIPVVLSIPSKEALSPSQQLLQRRGRRLFLLSLLWARQEEEISNNDIGNVRITHTSCPPTRQSAQVRGLQLPTASNSSNRQPGGVRSSSPRQPVGGQNLPTTFGNSSSRQAGGFSSSEIPGERSARQGGVVRTSRFAIGSSSNRQIGNVWDSRNTRQADGVSSSGVTAERSPSRPGVVRSSGFAIGGSPNRQTSDVRGFRNTNVQNLPVGQSEFQSDARVWIPSLGSPYPLDPPPSYEEAMRNPVYYRPSPYQDEETACLPKTF